MARTLIRGGTLLTADEARPVVDDGYLVVDGRHDRGGRHRDPAVRRARRGAGRRRDARHARVRQRAYASVHDLRAQPRHRPQSSALAVGGSGAADGRLRARGLRDQHAARSDREPPRRQHDHLRGLLLAALRPGCRCPVAHAPSTARAFAPCSSAAPTTSRSSKASSNAARTSWSAQSGSSASSRAPSAPRSASARLCPGGRAPSPSATPSNSHAGTARASISTPRRLPNTTTSCASARAGAMSACSLTWARSATR